MNEKKSILIISQYFYPEQFRINDLALEMKNRGYEVTVLTGLPNYPKGEYFKGYSKDKNCDEIWNGIPIYRCNLEARKTGSVNLIKNYMSFVYEANKKLKDLEQFHFDYIYVFEVSPMTVALPAIQLKKKRNIPVIINIQDLWPENIVAVTGMDYPFVVKPIEQMVKYIYENCDLILTASKSFVPNIQKYLKKAVHENDLDDIVIFHGRKPESEIPQYLANADAALLILKLDPVFEMTLPAKLQTYMACGVPIIGCVSGEGKRTIDESHAGVVSQEISVDGLVKACHEMLNKTKEEYELLKHNSLEYGFNNFNKEKLLDELFENMGGK